MDNGLRVNYPLLLPDFNTTSISHETFSKNAEISYFLKIIPVGADLFHANGRSDIHDEAYSRFSQVSKGA